MSLLARILWVCAERPAPEEQRLIETLKEFNFEVRTGLATALDQLHGAQIDAVVANFPMPECEPVAALEELHRAHPSIPILIRNNNGSFGEAVRLTRLGARYYFGPKLDPVELSDQLESAVEEHRSMDLAVLGQAVTGNPWRRYLVGESRAMRNILDVIKLVGPRRCTVLISGETGTGKEMAARALHSIGPRCHMPMVTVNCSALPEQLLEAELFGHVKGAFTGAISHRIGRFEQADRGTLFLDEIGELPFELQAKLLRVLQEREFQRLGSSETIHVDVRVVAASNQNLLEKVKEGKFREDLYYRLNVVPIEMPPLRDRLTDVPLLVRHFTDKICRIEDIPLKQVLPETLERLSSHSWPGNVRQLENAVEMAIALSGDRRVLYPSDFPLPSPIQWKSRMPHTGASVTVPDEGLDFDAVVGGIERNILEQALQKCGGNKKRAAELLRLKRTTLSAKLRTIETRTAFSCN